MQKRKRKRDGVEGKGNTVEFDLDWRGVQTPEMRIILLTVHLKYLY